MLISDFSIFIHPAISVGDTRWFIQWIPNNSYENFSTDLSKIIDLNEIVFEEIEKGIYVTKVKNKTLRFDMRGRIRKK